MTVVGILQENITKSLNTPKRKFDAQVYQP